MNDVVITSEPYGKFNEFNAIEIASVPLATKDTLLILKIFLNLFSNFETSLPNIN